MSPSAILLPPSPSSPTFYRKPPIIERVASVYAEIREEVFEARFDEWQAMVEAEYPVYEPLKEWLLLVEEKEGIPLLSSSRPELRITPRFSRKASREGYDWSIRCPAGQFTMNMHSTPGAGQDRRYLHLREEFARWLPRWLEHFEVKEPRLLCLHYVNVLNRATVPQFFSDANHLLLNRVISVFTNIPGKHECILPPYQCTANLQLGDRKDSSLRIELSDWGDPDGGPSMKLDLVVQTSLADEPVSWESFLALLDWEHEHMLARFEAVFTEEARQSFEPVPSA